MRSIGEHLSALWTSLFSGGPAEDSVQLSVSYGYPLGPAGLPDVSLPVLMVPRTKFSTPGNDDPALPTQEALVAALAARIQDWFDSIRPAGGGTITVNLQVLAAADGMPLLGLPDLRLPLSSVAPPLSRPNKKFRERS